MNNTGEGQSTRILKVHSGGIPRILFVGIVLICSACSWKGCVTLPKGPIEFVSATKPFFFDTVGNTEEFTVEISDMANYELALIAEKTPDCVFPYTLVDREPLRWKLDVSVWYRGKLLERQELGPAEAADDFDGDRDCEEILQLGILTTLKSLVGTKRLIVRVTVLAVDERYTDKNLPIRVGIRRSPRI